MSQWKFRPFCLELDEELDTGIDDGPLYGLRPVWLPNERGVIVYLGGLLVSLTWWREFSAFCCPCGDPQCDYPG